MQHVGQAFASPIWTPLPSSLHVLLAGPLCKQSSRSTQVPSKVCDSSTKTVVATNCAWTTHIPTCVAGRIPLVLVTKLLLPYSPLLQSMSQGCSTAWMVQASQLQRCVQLTRLDRASGSSVHVCLAQLGSQRRVSSDKLVPEPAVSI